MKLLQIYYKVTGQTLAKVLNRRIAQLELDYEKARDALAYALAMFNYHSSQIDNLSGKGGPKLLEAQLAQLEALEGMHYAETLCAYYTKLKDNLAKRLAALSPAS